MLFLLLAIAATGDGPIPLNRSIQPTIGEIASALLASPKPIIPSMECHFVSGTLMGKKENVDKRYLVLLRHDPASSEMFLLELAESETSAILRGEANDQAIRGAVRLRGAEDEQGLTVESPGSSMYVAYGPSPRPVLRASLAQQVAGLAEQARGNLELSESVGKSSKTLKLGNKAPIRLHGNTWGFFTAQIVPGEGRSIKGISQLSMSMSDGPLGAGGGATTRLIVSPNMGLELAIMGRLFASLDRLRPEMFPATRLKLQASDR